ncbi:serine hydrolase [Bifidobacterium sp. MA2]|uniref:Serine hydrolase n=1 Tax=Bifidobacterium santillanense TaxID=2809028 RepID=A0ABS5UN72_9BIFI|nr:serine hydrolase [Bifidobacterium santillanense]MBT1172362.1 serine hydrolase [Bifidobacterium santillanense]
MRFCMECGHQLEPDARFCTHCGARVSDAAPEPPAASPAPATPVLPAIPMPPGTSERRAVQPAVPNPPQPSRFPASDTSAPVPSTTPDAGAGAKARRVWVGVVAAIAAVAIVLGLVFAFVVRPGLSSVSTPGGRSDASDTTDSGSTGSPSSSKSSGSESESGATRPDSKSLSSITDKYSSTDVSVSAMFLNDDGSYTEADVANTAAARTKFVSAGLYLPVYLAARTDGGDSLTEAQSMMSTMDNAAANRAIADLGGFEAMNAWLTRHGYKDTTMERDFGDTQASAAGHENRSSTFDAVRMLAAVDAAGAADLMNVDVDAEGVTVPDDMTVHAHRGQGISNTWNYFAVVETPHGKAAVALATQNQGRSTATRIMSDVLADIDAQLDDADR